MVRTICISRLITTSSMITFRTMYFEKMLPQVFLVKIWVLYLRQKEHIRLLRLICEIMHIRSSLICSPWHSESPKVKYSYPEHFRSNLDGTLLFVPNHSKWNTHKYSSYDSKAHWSFYINHIIQFTTYRIYYMDFNKHLNSLRLRFKWDLMCEISQCVEYR